MTILFFFIAGVMKGFMDRVSSVGEYSVSIFPQEKTNNWLTSKDWYSKAESWQRKWKDGNPELGNKFPLSSTAFVGLTDFWHLCQTIMLANFILGALTFDNHFIIIDGIWDKPIYYIILITAISLGFTLSYNLTKRRKKNAH